MKNRRVSFFISVLFLLIAAVFAPRIWHEHIWKTLSDEGDARRYAGFPYPEAAKDKYEEALKEARKWEDKEQIYRSCMNLAGVALALNNEAEALDWYQQALNALGESPEDSAGREFVLSELAQLSINLKKYDQAETYANQLREVLSRQIENSNSARDNVVLLSYLAAIYIGQKKFELARNTCTRALEQCTDKVDKTGDLKKELERDMDEINAALKKIEK